MTTATSATREQNIWLIREMFKTVKPEHLTDDEIAAMAEILKAAQDRMQEPIRAGVVYLDLVRSRRHARLNSDS
jgi:excinuclease UvrABC ATPase subunit